MSLCLDEFMQHAWRNLGYYIEFQDGCIQGPYEESELIHLIQTRQIRSNQTLWVPTKASPCEAKSIPLLATFFLIRRYEEGDFHQNPRLIEKNFGIISFLLSLYQQMFTGWVLVKEENRIWCLSIIIGKLCAVYTNKGQATQTDQATICQELFSLQKGEVYLEPDRYAAEAKDLLEVNMLQLCRTYAIPQLDWPSLEEDYCVLSINNPLDQEANFSKIEQDLLASLQDSPTFRHLFQTFQLQYKREEVELAIFILLAFGAIQAVKEKQAPLIEAPVVEKTPQAVSWYEVGWAYLLTLWVSLILYVLGSYIGGHQQMLDKYAALFMATRSSILLCAAFLGHALLNSSHPFDWIRSLRLKCQLGGALMCAFLGGVAGALSSHGGPMYLDLHAISPLYLGFGVCAERLYFGGFFGPTIQRYFLSSWMVLVALMLAYSIYMFSFFNVLDKAHMVWIITALTIPICLLQVYSASLAYPSIYQIAFVVMAHKALGFQLQRWWMWIG